MTTESDNIVQESLVTRKQEALDRVRHLEAMLATNIAMLAELEEQTAHVPDITSPLWHRRNLAAALVDYYKDELKLARIDLFAATEECGHA